MDVQVQRKQFGLGRLRFAARQSAIALLLAVLLAAGGCAPLGNWLHNGFKVGPEYMKPAAPVAPEWIDFNDPRVISEQHCADNGAWWQAFNDPALDQLVLTAYQQNLPLRAASLRVLEAQAQRAIAAGNLFPQDQQAFINYNQTQISAAGNSIGFPLPIRSFGVWSTGFRAAWELDLWGRIRRRIEAADASLDASIENYDDVLVTLIADTASAYIELRAFQQREATLRENIELQDFVVTKVERQFGGGEAEKQAWTQLDTTLYQSRALEPVLDQQKRLAANRLCVLLGIPPRNLAQELGDVATHPLPVPPEHLVVGIPADLIRRRPDIRRAEREVAAQSAQIGIAAADLFPSFSIQGQLNWQAADFGDLFSPAASGGFIQPGFDWKILNYGRIANNIAAQDARFQQLAVTYQQTVLNANREAEDAIIQFLREHERMQYLGKASEQADETYRLVRNVWDVGGRTDFNLFDAVTRAKVRANDDYIAAQAEVALALIRVYRALGGGWELRFGHGMPVMAEAPSDAAALPPGPQPEGAAAEAPGAAPPPAPAPQAPAAVPAEGGPAEGRPPVGPAAEGQPPAGPPTQPNDTPGR